MNTPTTIADLSKTNYRITSGRNYRFVSYKGKWWAEVVRGKGQHPTFIAQASGDTKKEAEQLAFNELKRMVREGSIVL